MLLFCFIATVRLEYENFGIKFYSPVGVFSSYCLRVYDAVNAITGRIDAHTHTNQCEMRTDTHTHAHTQVYKSAGWQFQGKVISIFASREISLFSNLFAVCAMRMGARVFSRCAQQTVSRAQALKILQKTHKTLLFGWKLFYGIVFCVSWAMLSVHRSSKQPTRSWWKRSGRNDCENQKKRERAYAQTKWTQWNYANFCGDAELARRRTRLHWKKSINCIKSEIHLILPIFGRASAHARVCGCLQATADSAKLYSNSLMVLLIFITISLAFGLCHAVALVAVTCLQPPASTECRVHPKTRRKYPMNSIWMFWSD